MHRLLRGGLLGLAGTMLALSVGCAAPGRTGEAVSGKPPHHREDGFQNSHIEFAPRNFAALLRWKWQAWREGVPRPPREPVPVVPPDLGFVQANARAGAAMQPAVTWIGHATVLAQLGGLNVLTDPIFSERASPLSFAGPRRAQPPGLSLAELPRIDVVLVSHNHYDHLDEASVRALAAQPGGPPLFIAPLGHREWFESLGVARLVELDWWQAHRIGAVEFVLTPVQHWSGRGFADRMRALWGGWAVFAPDCHLYFSGDTGFSPDFAEVRRRFAPRQHDGAGGGFDIALVAIGGWAPRWFMKDQHVDPAEAVQIHLDLGAKRSLGVHWGTFELTDESLDEPPRELAAQRAAKGVAEADFFVLAIGQTRTIPARSTRAAGTEPEPAAAAPTPARP